MTETANKETHRQTNNLIKQTSKKHMRIESSGASPTDVCHFFTLSINLACKFILGHTTNSVI